jgi:hypothetical protein
MHETILLVRPNLRFGSSLDFNPETLSCKAAALLTEGSIAAVVEIAAVCKNFLRVNFIFIRLMFCFFKKIIPGNPDCKILIFYL